MQDCVFHMQLEDGANRCIDLQGATKLRAFHYLSHDIAIKTRNEMD